MADDEGVKRTDEEFNALVERLTRAYAQAAFNLQVKFNKYMADFARKDKQKRQDLDAGLITDEEYKRWRLGQILIGHRWQEMVDTMTGDLVKVDQFAMAMVTDSSYDVFAVNHNYGTFEVEQGSNLNTFYTLYDRHTVANLVRNQPDLLPAPRVNIPKDMVWNKQHLVSSILQGVMQGESIGEIATRLQGVADMDRKAALRNARTMMTFAQNAGRQASYERAEEKGIHGMKMWVAAHDERVRASHAAIDNEQVAVDEKFSNGLMYPGDKSGDPSEVYNCRCRVVYRVGKVDLSAYVKNKPEEQMSYQQWEAQHQSGASSGAKKTPGWQGRHAENYYEEVRNRAPYSDANRIVKNVQGFTVDEIEEIRQHMFIREQPRDGGLKRFDPDYDQAEAWQRLIDGRNIKESDIVMLCHERLELTIMQERGCIYEEAHAIAEKVFNYDEALAKEKEAEL